MTDRIESYSVRKFEYSTTTTAREDFELGEIHQTAVAQILNRDDDKN